MSSTMKAPYLHLGSNGDYPIEANFGVRVYDDKGERIPQIGALSYTLKGGLRTNHIGMVPLLNGKKEEVGKAEVLKIISATLENMDGDLILLCGFASKQGALDYVLREHREEYERDGVITIFVYKVISLV